jgi:hypothetical protein
VSDRNGIAYWQPRLEAAGLPTPETVIAEAPGELTGLLEGELPDGWHQLVAALHAGGDRVGWPAFLRAGHTSGKHQWRETCHVPGPEHLERHIAAIVEASALAGFFGLPTHEWAIRRLLAVEPICRCDAYRGMPVVREFRLFVDGDVTHTQPYWPPDAVERGNPDADDWRPRLAAISTLTDDERRVLRGIALDAWDAVGRGHWSVDLLQDADGGWWLTDMADGDQSYRWEP